MSTKLRPLLNSMQELGETVNRTLKSARIFVFCPQGPLGAWYAEPFTSTLKCQTDVSWEMIPKSVDRTLTKLLGQVVALNLVFRAGLWDHSGFVPTSI